jgi:hypothetical protein
MISTGDPVVDQKLETCARALDKISNRMPRRGEPGWDENFDELAYAVANLCDAIAYLGAHR